MIGVAFLDDVRATLSIARDANALSTAFIALIVTVSLMMPVRWLAIKIGALSLPGGRNIHEQPTPRLGGVAMAIGVGIAAWSFMTVPVGRFGVVLEAQWISIAIGAALVVVVGAIDDWRGTPWLLKLGAQIIGAAIAVAGSLYLAPNVGVSDLPMAIQRLDLPITSEFNLPPWLAIGLPVFAVVVVMNVMNFIDGIDGLAAGVCAIVAITLCILAASYGRVNVGILAAATVGAALAYLPFNMSAGDHRIFMGDSGSQLLGFLLGVVAVQGVIKTSAFVALAAPMVLLLVPLLDTSFVVAKRIKHKVSPTRADTWHFHHRLINAGVNPRTITVMLWLWTASVSLFALAMRYSDFRPRGQWNADGVVTLVGFGAVALASTIVMLFKLEILKTRSVRARNESVRRAASRE